MRGIRLLILAAAALLIAMPFVNASGCGTLPSSVSALTLYCIPANIVNTQSTATPSGFQQMLTFNALNYSSYLSGNLENIYVYNSLSGAQIPAWIEGNSLNEQQTTSLNTSANVIIWVNLGANTISASGSASQYYIGIGSTNTNFFLSGNNIGEAPQLSPTYAEYDDGNNVFTNYWNFAGTSLPSGWTNMGSATTTTVNNGVSMASGSGSGNDAGWYYANYQIPLNSVIEALYKDTGAGSTRGSSIGIGTGIYGGGIRVEDYEITPAAGSAWGPYGIEGYASGYETSVGYTSGTLMMLSGAYYSTGATIYSNYQSILTESGTATTSDTYPNFGVYQDALFIQYMRVRAYPPNGVMPAASFGSVQTVSRGQLVISPNPATYGQSISITATCTPSTDSCAVEYPIGTEIATGTGSASYSISCTTQANCWAVGNYLFSGNDLTSGAGASSTLVITKATPSTACTFNGGALVSGATTNSLLASAPLACTISTLGSQASSTLTYNSVDEGSSTSGVSFGTAWDNKNNPFTWSSPATANFTSADFTGSIDYLPYIVLDAIAPGGTQYETSTQKFDYELNVSKVFTTANVALTQNNVPIMWSNQTAAKVPQWFNFTYLVPLQASNDIVYTYNGDFQATAPLTDYGTFNTVKQTTLWDYYVSGAWKYASIIEGDTQTLFANLTQPSAMQNAAISNVTAKVGSQTLHPLLLTTYHYYSTIKSFTANAFGLTAPTTSASVTIPMNSLSFTLTFNGNSITRSMTNTPTFNDSVGTLVACNATYTDIAFNYTFWNASQPTQQYTANVQLNGFYQVVNGAYTGPSINGTDAGLSAKATSDQYETCQTPADIKFPVSGGFSYQTPNSIIAQYFLVQQSSQPKNNIHLYISSALTSIAQYNIGVENVTTLTFIPALVEVAQYIPNTNSSVVVNEFQTSAGSGYVVDLEQGTIYRLIAYTLSGTYLTTTPYFQASCTSGQICSKTILIGNTTSSLLQNIIGNIHVTCGYIYNTTPNTTQVSCNFNSINGTSQLVSLYLWQNATAGAQANLFCQRNVTSVSGSVACTGTQTNTTSYFWKLFLNTSYGAQLITQGNFGPQSSLFGDIGWLLLLIGIIAAGCLFVFINPALGILGTVVVVAVEGVLGFFVLTGIALGATIAFGAIAAYTAYKKQSP